MYRIVRYLSCAGFLQAYDQHLNMILGEVEESATTVELDDETFEEIVKVNHIYEITHILSLGL